MALDPSRRLSADFTLGEFINTSKRPLTEADVPQIQWWVDTILQPARRANGRIRITSYIRPEDVGRAHENGGGIDVVPIDVTVPTLHAWIATYQASSFGRIIDERNHVHVARPGPEAWAGRGVVLREPVEGQYEFASIVPAPVLAALGATNDPFVRVASALAHGTVPAVADLTVVLLWIGAFLLLLLAWKRRSR